MDFLLGQSFSLIVVGIGITWWTCWTQPPAIICISNGFLRALLLALNSQPCPSVQIFEWKIGLTLFGHVSSFCPIIYGQEMEPHSIPEGHLRVSRNSLETRSAWLMYQKMSVIPFFSTGTARPLTPEL